MYTVSKSAKKYVENNFLQYIDEASCRQIPKAHTVEKNMQLIPVTPLVIYFMWNLYKTLLINPKF